MTTLSVDAVPVEVQDKFIKKAYERGSFWGDMFTLCLSFGLRNSEARELHIEHVDLAKCRLQLTDSKQVRSHITKVANKIINDSWMIAGRKWLRANIDDQNISLIVRLANDVQGLHSLADEYDVLEQYLCAQDTYRANSINAARQEAAKTAPKGRIIDFSRLPKAKRIIEARISKYGALCGYLFPSCELNNNRANEFAPVTRQSVYRVIKDIRIKLETISKSVAKSLTGIRLGLHSMRKAAVQKVNNALDMMAASIWIGHGNGSGDIATTQRYLDRSEKRMNEINRKLSEME